MRAHVHQEADGYWTIADADNGDVPVRTGLRSKLEAYVICDREEAAGRWTKTERRAPISGKVLLERARTAGMFADEPRAF
jgi:hypothetical protein